MKTFLNILYRRILYKIPLKLLLVLLAIFGLLFACTKAETVENLISYLAEYNYNSLNQNQVVSFNYFNSNTPDGVYCFVVDYTYNGNGVTYISLGGSDKNYDLPWGSVDLYNYAVPNAVCTYNLGDYFNMKARADISNVSVKVYSYDDLISTNLPKLTSLQCQSEYSLIPISEVDSEYCESNNLCSSGGTPSDCPNVGISNLFINDIFHPGAFNIIMNIPEEISRDYAYTNSGYNFNLDIEGYNVDYEKMQSVIDNQSYIPTEEDFQNIIAILTPYTKIIVFFVFLFIVWAWIKKPFKSKKL